MPVRINGLNTGSVTLSASATGGDVTLNLPNANGTVATTSYADTAPGLQFIASQDCGTAASISFNNVFTSTYDVYFLTFSRIAKSGSPDNFRARLRLNGTDAITNYSNQFFQASSTTMTSGQQTAQTSHRFGSISVNGESAILLHIFNPAVATTTIFISSTLYAPSNAPTILNYVGNHTTATAYDGITIYPESNAFNGGTIKIYGLRNS